MLFHEERQQKGWLCFLLAALLLCGLVGFMGACAVVPKHMQVDTGLHPKNQDRDVRFRTTYYFRVFDYCADPNKGGIKTPFAIDSLYRFRMTGKANSLTTSVNFESGTLTAGQIDPFGATVMFDKENRRFFFKTQDQVQREAARENQFDELDRLLYRYRELKEMLRTNAEESDVRVSAEDQPLIIKFRALIESQIALIKGVPGGLSPIEELDQLVDKYQTLREELESKPPAELSDEEKQFLDLLKLLVKVIKHQINRYNLQNTELSQVSSEQNYCQNIGRGFQILGPEGWRTFNQDDRLIMAMNATGEPLIATLQELAGRVLDNQPVQAELLLPIIEEDLRISRTERALDKFSPDEPEKVSEILEKALNTFKEGTK